MKDDTVAYCSRCNTLLYTKYRSFTLNGDSVSEILYCPKCRAEDKRIEAIDQMAINVLRE